MKDLYYCYYDDNAADNDVPADVNASLWENVPYSGYDDAEWRYIIKAAEKLLRS